MSTPPTLTPGKPSANCPKAGTQAKVPQRPSTNSPKADAEASRALGKFLSTPLGSPCPAPDYSRPRPKSLAVHPPVKLAVSSQSTSPEGSSISPPGLRSVARVFRLENPPRDPLRR
jgi:hypothetical protein